MGKRRMALKCERLSTEHKNLTAYLTVNCAVFRGDLYESSIVVVHFRLSIAPGLLEALQKLAAAALSEIDPSQLFDSLRIAFFELLFKNRGEYHRKQLFRPVELIVGGNSVCFAPCSYAFPTLPNPSRHNQTILGGNLQLLLRPVFTRRGEKAMRKVEG